MSLTPFVYGNHDRPARPATDTEARFESIQSALSALIEQGASDTDLLPVIWSALDATKGWQDVRGKGSIEIKQLHGEALFWLNHIFQKATAMVDQGFYRDDVWKQARILLEEFCATINLLEMAALKEFCEAYDRLTPKERKNDQTT